MLVLSTTNAEKWQLLPKQNVSSSPLQCSHQISITHQQNLPLFHNQVVKKQLCIFRLKTI
jgi:hypothetical protein